MKLTLHHVGIAPERLKGRSAFNQGSPDPDLPDLPDLPDPGDNLIELHQKADDAP